ncbi:MAG TPA: hypothetical protein VJ689_01095 [Gaiellaceae bacterium]|jgi:hypothetical protein|nr:hypothetical protein [Gaiellaceae bacterium]
MKRFRKRTLVLLAIGVVAIVAAFGAYAFWTQSGSGTGSATAGTTNTITVNQTSTVTGLYPDGPAAPLSGDFTNPNASEVHISSVTAAVSSITGAGTDGTKPACTIADFAIGGSSGPTDVPVGTNVGSWSGLTISLVDNGLNQDNCKNATANISYTANP